MKNTYKIKGMTCSSCAAKVQSALSRVNGIDNVIVSLNDGETILTGPNKISLITLQKALYDVNPKYELHERNHDSQSSTATSWVITYKPILLIFVYLIGTASCIELTHENLNIMRWMQNFMAGFFLAFSFFKLLNLQGFRSSFQRYDVIAKQFPNYSYVYAFTELLLGVAYLTNFQIILTSSIALTVMLISIVGVLQAVLSKKSIKCACLGDVFNLPMSTVTIIENGLMILMSSIVVFNG